MIYFIYTIHIVVCIFLILVVLLQQGKGADLSVFGGGSTQTVFGARGAATFLHKMTVFGFIAFTLTTISIGLLTGTSRRSVMSGAEPTAAAEVATEAVDEAAGEPLEVAEPTAPAEEAGTDPAAAGEENPAESEPPTEDPNDPQN